MDPLGRENVPQGMSSAGVIIRNWTALLSAGAAGIHFAVASDRFQAKWLLGLFFIAVAVFQVGGAVFILARPSRALLWAGTAVNSIVMLIWFFSRIFGVHLGPAYIGMEDTGFIDTVANMFELFIVIGTIMLLATDAPSVAIRQRATGRATFVGAVTVMPLAAAAMFASFTPAPTTLRQATSLASGNDGSTGTDASRSHRTAHSASTRTVKMLDNEFSPVKLRIEPGGTVRWVNEGQAPHTATADTRVFDSGNVDPGATYSFTFEEEGTYYYYCAYHGAPGETGMWGVITVAEKGDKAVPVKVGSVPDPVSKGSSVPATASVSVLDDSFSPQELNITAGDTVEWLSKSSLPHTVTADDGAFDSGDLTSGSSYSQTFDEAGVYHYYCTYHGSPGGGMWATVIVADPGKAAPTDTGHPASHTGHVTIPDAPRTSKVSVEDNLFSPISLKIDVGDTVVWANEGQAPHNSTADSGTFASPTMNPGQTYRYTFERAGTYTYMCTIHGASMRGTIVVREPGKSTAPKVPAKHSPPPKRTPTPKPAPGSEQIKIKDDAFIVKQVTIDLGTTVQWVNTGRSPHTVTAESKAPVGFDSGNLDPGQAFEIKFRKAGDYFYYCLYHGGPRSGMWGVVHVGSGGGGAPPPPNPSPPPRPPSPPPGDGQPAVPQVLARNDAFSPKALTVTEGDTVVWTNKEDRPHTVTLDGAFDSGQLGLNDDFSFRFTKAGTYRYYCRYHRSKGMTGTVTVVPTAVSGTNRTPQDRPRKTLALLGLGMLLSAVPETRRAIWRRIHSPARG